ncbi:MAG: HDOD domain-containing protein [Gammaproteobacteria bacterium]|nr:HDOD domain-containing protein [Gammaproteobacteria bacterium]
MDIGQLVCSTRLPSPAPVVLKLFDEIESGGADDIARIIESDPAITARLLRLANSAFYVKTPVGSVREAVVRVGTLDVAGLVLSTEVVRIFRGISERAFSMETFWDHSLLTACYANALMRPGLQQKAAPIWVCGLLHDIGKLCLVRQAPNAYRTVLDRVEAGTPLLEAENEILGVTHAKIGGVLLQEWRLPAVLAACAEGHHAGYDGLDSPSSVVAAANEVANQEKEVKDLPGRTEAEAEQVTAGARRLYDGYRQLFSEYWI